MINPFREEKKSNFYIVGVWSIFALIATCMLLIYKFRKSITPVFQFGKGEVISATNSDVGLNIDPANGTASIHNDNLNGIDWVRFVVKKEYSSSSFYPDKIEDYHKAGVDVLCIINSETIPSSICRQNETDCIRLEVQKLSEFLSGKCNAYEIGNEPDLLGYSAPLFGEFVTAAIQGISEVDNKAMVILGGFGSSAGDIVSYYNKLGLSPDILSKIDAVSVHPYGQKIVHPDYKEPIGVLGDLVQYMSQLRAMDKPIWITEIGWECSDGEQCKKVAAYMESFYKDANAGVIFWFAWSDAMVDEFGIIKSSYEKKPYVYDMFYKIAGVNTPPEPKPGDTNVPVPDPGVTPVPVDGPDPGLTGKVFQVSSIYTGSYDGIGRCIGATGDMTLTCPIANTISKVVTVSNSTAGSGTSTIKLVQAVRVKDMGLADYFGSEDAYGTENNPQNPSAGPAHNAYSYDLYHEFPEDLKGPAIIESQIYASIVGSKVPVLTSGYITLPGLGTALGPMIEGSPKNYSQKLARFDDFDNVYVQFPKKFQEQQRWTLSSFIKDLLDLISTLFSNLTKKIGIIGIIQVRDQKRINLTCELVDVIHKNISDMRGLDGGTIAGVETITQNCAETENPKACNASKIDVALGGVASLYTPFHNLLLTYSLWEQQNIPRPGERFCHDIGIDFDSLNSVPIEIEYEIYDGNKNPNYFSEIENCEINEATKSTSCLLLPENFMDCLYDKDLSSEFGKPVYSEIFKYYVPGAGAIPAISAHISTILESLDTKASFPEESLCSSQGLIAGPLARYLMENLPEKDVKAYSEMMGFTEEEYNLLRKPPRIFPIDIENNSPDTTYGPGEWPEPPEIPDGVDYITFEQFTSAGFSSILAKRLELASAAYLKAQKATGIPWQVWAALHIMEYSAQFGNPANGEGPFGITRGFWYMTGSANPFPAGPFKSHDDFVEVMVKAAPVIHYFEKRTLYYYSGFSMTKLDSKSQGEFSYTWNGRAYGPSYMGSGYVANNFNGQTNMQVYDGLGGMVTMTKDGYLANMQKLLTIKF